MALQAYAASLLKPTQVIASYQCEEKRRGKAIPEGRIKWFNEQKGFGFVSQESGDDLCMHFSSIKQDGCKLPYEGDEVEFGIDQGNKGFQAADVVKC